MSAIIHQQYSPAANRLLPLLKSTDLTQVFAWRGAEAISEATFLAHIAKVAAVLPESRFVANLCEDRYHFLVAFCAAAVRGQTNLLPPSRASHAVSQILHSHPGAYTLGDCDVATKKQGSLRIPELSFSAVHTEIDIPSLVADQVVVIGYTSGSTGTPKPNAKTWASLHTSSAMNAALLDSFCTGERPGANIVATVPPQHMYGLEMSVLLPLLGDFAVHTSKPLFPADVARALADVSAPRILVTTPVHLRALLRSGESLPAIAAIVSATAPLTADLAAEAERRYLAPVIEVFGSTETCVIAQRRTARAEPWQLYPGVELKGQPNGTLVDATHFSAPVLLADIVELLPQRRFALSGRNSDMLEIAGKRASLGDLTRRLVNLPGVEDGVIFQLDADTQTGLARVAALVVAPKREALELLAELRQAIDPAFMPRPLKCVDRLPRDEAGKLPREALLCALRDGTRKPPER